MDNAASSAVDASVDDDISLLRQSIANLKTVTASLESLAADPPWSDLGYFDAAQHDAIEHLFFRFMVSRRVLVSLALPGDSHDETSGDDNNDAVGRALSRAESSFADDAAPDAVHVLRTLVILASAMALFVHEVKFVKCFREDRVAVAKLNQRFYRSGIEEDTYDKLRLECTDASTGDRVRNLAAAYDLLYSQNSQFQLKDITEGKYDEELSHLMALVDEADALVKEFAGKIALPPLRNKIQHAPLGGAARQTKSGIKNVLRETRARTFKGVSRLKSPTAHLIKFSDEQKRDVLGRLQPGDMIFTYTAGFMSDVFIPGAFKHGITYVGSPEDRDEAGLNADGIAKIYDELPEGEAGTLLQQFKTASLTSPARAVKAQDADVIEAIAEGVIFSSLCTIMDTHVNRLLVLRPIISSEERTDALVSVFRYLGAKYDFGFNFSNTGAVVCTEVQYHAFNGKGKLAFELTKRAGHPTLSADDIVNYHLAKPGSFDFVLLALEDEMSSCHDARVVVGEDGNNVLAEMMASESR